jgi:hypothetical protein
VFTDGDSSVQVSGGRIELTDNSWSDYDGSIFDSYSASSTRPHRFLRNSVADVGGYVVYAGGGPVEVEDVTVTSTREREVSYASYTNDVLDYEVSYTSSSAAFGGYGYRASDGSADYPAALTLRDVTVGSTVAGLLYTNDVAVVLDNVAADTVGTGSSSDGVYATWQAFPASFEAMGVTLGAVGADAFDLTNGSTEEGYVLLQEVSVASAGGSGVLGVGLHTLDLMDVTLGTTGGWGVDTTARFYGYDGTLGSYVARVTPGAVGATRLQHEGGAGGVRVQGAVLAMELSSLGAQTGACVEVSGGATVDLYDVSCAGAGTVGVSVDEDWSWSDTSGAITEVDADTVTHLTGVHVSNAPLGMLIDGGSAGVASSSADGTCAVGLSLTDTRAEVTDSSFVGLSEYGMTCEEVTFDVCGGNDLSGNGLGTVQGCPESCGR